MLELIVLFSFCVLLGLGCFGALGWVLFGSEELGVERIFLMFVAFALGALFLGMAGWMARTTQLQVLWKPRKKELASKPGEMPAPEPEAAREETGKPAS